MADCKRLSAPTRDVHVAGPVERAKPPLVHAILDRESGSILMLVDDPAEAEAIMNELRRSGVQADIVAMAAKPRPVVPLD
jgi:hypothetical protein